MARPPARSPSTVSPSRRLPASVCTPSHISSKRRPGETGRSLRPQESPAIDRGDRGRLQPPPSVDPARDQQALFGDICQRPAHGTGVRRAHAAGGQRTKDVHSPLSTVVGIALEDKGFALTRRRDRVHALDKTVIASILAGVMLIFLWRADGLYPRRARRHLGSAGGVVAVCQPVGDKTVSHVLRSRPW